MLSNEEIEYNRAFFGTDEAPIQQEDDTEEESVETPEVQEEVIEDTKEDTTEEVQPEEEVKEEEEPKEEAPQEEMVTLMWNGKEVQVTKEEQLKLAQQGFDYTFKTQTLSKYKKQFEAMEEAGIKESDIELLKRIKGGDKEAMAYLLQETKSDPFELSSIENPKVTLQNEPQGIVISNEVKPLIEQISHDSELLGKLQQAEEMLPDAVIRAMAQNAELFYGVVSEVQNGTFNEVMPQLQRRLATMSDLDRAYVLQNPNQFATLYVNVKNTANKPQPQPQIPNVEMKKEKPNMAEVGIKKSSTVTRQEEVIKDAFNSDAEYQRILEKLRNR